MSRKAALRGFQVLLHVVGLSTVMAAALFLLWTFLTISTQGSFRVGEDNLTIRYGELVLVSYGVGYAFFLLARFCRKT